MGRGGSRKGAGRKSGWNSDSRTRTIRVPEAISERLLEIAHWIDDGNVIDFVSKSKPVISSSKIEFVTESKVCYDLDTKSIWFTTREVWDSLGQPKAWNTFRKLTPSVLLNEFGVIADPSRKVKGKTDSRWLRFQADEF